MDRHKGNKKTNLLLNVASQLGCIEILTSKKEAAAFGALVRLLIEHPVQWTEKDCVIRTSLDFSMCIITWLAFKTVGALYNETAHAEALEYMVTAHVLPADILSLNDHIIAAADFSAPSGSVAAFMREVFEKVLAIRK